MRYMPQLRNAYLGQKVMIDGMSAEVTCYQVFDNQVIANVTYYNGCVERIIIDRITYIN